MKKREKLYHAEGAKDFFLAWLDDWLLVRYNAGVMTVCKAQNRLLTWPCSSVKTLKSSEQSSIDYYLPATRSYLYQLAALLPYLSYGLLLVFPLINSSLF